jgi:hypothetical protein
LNEKSKNELLKGWKKVDKRERLIKKTFTEKELNKRIDKAEAHSSNNRLVSVHDLKSEINSWK